MRIYHTGYQEIREPDVRYGRKNADFGQGFYLTADGDFARRWARERKGVQTVLNIYELDPEGLAVQRFQRDREWFDYIFRNRGGYEDRLRDIDVIIGPIANDTIYNTFGVLTSGLLEPETALQVLQLGPEYRQIVLKTEKAAGRLQWIGAEILSGEEIRQYRERVSQEEEAYQRQLAKTISF